jgi:hypothetical protein
MATWPRRGGSSRFGSIVAVAVLATTIGTAGVATAVQRAASTPGVTLSGTPANAVRGLHRVGTSNMSAGSRATAGTYARMPEHETRNAGDQAWRDLLAGRAPSAPALAKLLGGSNAPASNVVGNGPTADGFNGLDLVQMQAAGHGKYAGTNSGLEPPDQALCVGNGFVLEGVNQAWRVHKTNSQTIPDTTQTITEFFKIPPSQATPPSSFVSDPRCVYDATSGHWFAITLEADEASGLTEIPFLRSHTYIAVSRTADPTKTWDVYSIDVTDDGLNGTPLHHSCPCIDDQPLIGINGSGLYISANQFSNSEIFPFSPPTQVWQVIGTLPDYRNGQAQLYAMSKQALIGAKGGTMPPVVSFDTGTVPVPAADQGKSPISLWSSLQPASPPPGDRTANPSQGVEYFLSQLDFQGTGDNRIAVWAMNNTAFLQSKPSSVRLLNKVITTNSGTYTSAAFGVEQKNTTNPKKDRPIGDRCGCPLEKLNANDDRMQQVTLINGALWSAMNTALPDAFGVHRSGIMYFKVQPSVDGRGQLGATMARDGYVQVKNNNVIFPSIAANTRGAVAMFFTLTGHDYFPSAAWARLDVPAPAGAGPDVHVSGAGQGPEDGFTGYPISNQLGLPLDPGLGDGTARWGDYSYASTDEQGCLWGAAEYISGIERDPNAGNWATFITRIKTPGCNPTPFQPALPTTNPCGPAFTDPAHDDVAASDIAPVPGTSDQNGQLDILEGRIAVSADRTTITTTLKVRNLSTTTFATGSSANEYYVYWAFGGKTYYTNVEVDRLVGNSGNYGTVDASGRTPSGTATPSLDTKSGTVTLTVPASAASSPGSGAVLTAIKGETRALTGVLVIQYDHAGPMWEYKVGEVCKK